MKLTLTPLCLFLSFFLSFFLSLSLSPPSLPPSDRVVDDLNPMLNFTRREVESLHFVEEEPEPAHLQLQPQDTMEAVLRKVLHIYPHLITKVGGEAHIATYKHTHHYLKSLPRVHGKCQPKNRQI